MAQIGPHLVRARIKESAASLSPRYGQQPDYSALCFMPSFGWNGLRMAQNGPWVLQKCQKRCSGALAHMGFQQCFWPKTGCPLSMRVAVATKRCPVYLPSHNDSFCRPKMQRCVQKGSPSCLIDMYMASGRPSVYLHGPSQIQNLFRLQPSGMLGREGGRVSCNLTEACPASPRNNVVVTGRYLWGAQECPFVIRNMHSVRRQQPAICHVACRPVLHLWSLQHFIGFSCCWFVRWQCPCSMQV